MARILREAEVIKRTGWSRVSIYYKVKEGSFPAPITIGPRAKGWLESEIDSWIEARVQESREARAALAATKARDPNRWMKRNSAQAA